jgi:hypothetical protein
MTHIPDCSNDAKIGLAAQTAVTLARLEVPLAERLTDEEIKPVIKARLDLLQTLGGLTQEETRALKARVDGTEEVAGQVSPIFGSDGQLSLAGVLGRGLPDPALEGSVQAAYVAATSAVGAAVFGIAVCGTPCAVIAACQATVIVQSLRSGGGG